MVCTVSIAASLMDMTEIIEGRSALAFSIQDIGIHL